MAGIFSPDTEDGNATQTIPSYLLGTDAHNMGNQGNSWFDPTTWGDRLTNGFEFGAASIVSGAAQIYNSGVTIGNWLGASNEEADISGVMSSLDSDLGAYYDKNRQSVDLAGFIVSSFAPGLGGIKILNAGQKMLEGAIATGKIGGNLARATGLLVPKTEMYITAAAKDINAANATFSAINQAGIKALASGVGQQVLEGIAFETAVQATLFKSPVLSNQDSTDIIKNIAMGGVLNGVIGGAIAGFGIKNSINKLVAKFELEGKPLAGRNLQQEVNSPSARIIQNSEELELGAQPLRPVGGETQEALDTLRVDRQNYTDKVTRIQNESRTQVHEMTLGNNPELSNTIADTLTGMSSQDTLNVLLHTKQVSRLSETTTIEKEINDLAKKGEPVDPNLQVSVVKLQGEGAGTVSEGAPVVQSLADTVSKSKNQTLMDAIFDRVKDFKFKAGTLWDAGTKSGSRALEEAQARYIWADGIKEIKDGTIVHVNDIPLLERAYKDGQTNIKLVNDKGDIVSESFASRQELLDHLVSTKEDVANSLLKKIHQNLTSDSDAFGTEAIAKIVNTKLSRLDGSAVGEDFKDYFAHQSATEDYKNLLKSKGLPAADDLDTRMLPSYAKVAKRAEDLVDVDGHQIDGMTWLKQMGRKAQMEVDNVLAKNIGSLAASIPEISDDLVIRSFRTGAGATRLGFANGNYGTLESAVQAIGSLTNKIKVQFRTATKDTLEGPLAALARNEEASIEFQTINQKITRSAKQWIRHTEDGEEYMITREAKAKLDKVNEEGEPITPFEDLDEGDLIPIANLETKNAIDGMISRSGTRTSAYQELRAAQGKVDSKDPLTYRPVRSNPKDYPNFAFVKDDKVTAQGHTTMIFAKDASTLKALADKAESAGYRVHYKNDTEEFHQAYGDYEYQRTLNESYIDSDLKNRGIYSDHFTKTDPQKTVNDILQQHLREDDVMAMEMMRAKNQKAFDYLEDQGKAYSKVQSSTLGGSSIARIESAGKNPYLDYIKTALDVSKISEYPLLYSFNKFLDDAVSKGVGAIRDTFSSAKTPADMEKINGILDKYGMNTGYRDAALDLLVNHTAPKGELTKFVRTANAVMSKLTLGLDPMNSLNNAIGANILRGTELKQITDAIKSGDSDLAGKLSLLMKTSLPGVGDEITTPGKLMLRSIKNFVSDTGELTQRYKDAGYIKDISTQFRQIVDDFTLKGTESVSDLSSRLSRGIERAKSLSETGEKYTGNKLAEEFNRFISADVMRQITDLAESKGLLTRAESHSYINTFVNRVEGNTIASQRPMMFQGPIGQAIGLFQSYQFNLMQQLFRYTAEGSAKDTAMLLGLQGTFYGLQGLPGFQFINQHIIGTASGNKKHVDAYDATYGIAGKQMGDLLLYGLPSNLLQSNLYSRGDINPRSVTVLPTSLPDVPFIGGLGKFLMNVKDTAGKIAAGGDVWESFLQGVEHNGLSRPLAGFAQTLQSFGPQGMDYSTTSKGSILYSNDLFSLGTLTRLAGGRPIAEAIINDGVFRINAYNQMDRIKMNDLAETVKSTVIAGNRPDGEQVMNFAGKYAEYGGKQANFNKFMLTQMKNANVPQAQQIVTQLQNPFSRKMQTLMGGDSDF